MKLVSSSTFYFTFNEFHHVCIRTREIIRGHLNVANLLVRHLSERMAKWQNLRLAMLRRLIFTITWPLDALSRTQKQQCQTKSFFSTSVYNFLLWFPPFLTLSLSLAHRDTLPIVLCSVPNCFISFQTEFSFFNSSASFFSSLSFCSPPF